MGIRAQRGPRRVIIPVTLIVVGILFLFNMNLLWPLFVLVPGLVVLGASLMGGRAAAPLSIPGMLISGTGALLFIQNLTNYWESWSYAWALYFVFLGLGFVFMGRKLGNPKTAATGQGFMFFGLVSFAFFAFLFELVFGIGDLGSIGWPWLFIMVGIFLLLKNILRHPSRPKHKMKLRSDSPVFTGPVVHRSRKREYDLSRLTMPDDEGDR